MTLYDLARLIRQNVTKIAFVAVACALMFLLYSSFTSLMNPSHKATSTIVTIGGSFASTSGIANHIASQESKDGVTVSATATSASNTVTFNATASSAEAAMDACNTVANEVGKQAKNSGAANSYNVTEATSAKSTKKSPLIYAALGFAVGACIVIALIVVRISIHRTILSPAPVEEFGLFCLGSMDAKAFQASTIVANICFKCRNDEGGVDGRLRVLLHPTNKNVRVNEVGGRLAPEASKIGMTLKKTPPLGESAYALYLGGEADAVVVVVEEGTSTFYEIEEIVKEFEVAGLNTAGFVFLPRKTKGAGHSSKR